MLRCLFDPIKGQKYLILLLNKFLFKTKMNKMAENSGDILDHQIMKRHLNCAFVDH